MTDSQNKKMEACKNCGHMMRSSELTCPQCGHTQWGVITFMGVISLFFIASLVWYFQSNTSIAICGGFLGVIFLMATIYNIVKALKGPVH